MTPNDKIKKILKDFRPYQQKWLADLSRYRLCAKARQIGMTYTVSFEMLVNAFFKNRQTIYISASLDNALSTKAYIKEFAEKLNIDISSSQKTIELPNGVSIFVLSSNWRTARSFAGDVYLDEFAYHVSGQKLYSAAAPMITSVNGRLSILSTVHTQADYFWTLYSSIDYYSVHEIDIYKAKKEGLDIDINELKKIFDKNSFENAYLLKPLDTQNAFISFEDLEKSLISEPVKTENIKSIGIDIGRSKGLTAVCFIEEAGGQLILQRVETLKGKDFDYQFKYISDLLSSVGNVPIYIDKGSIGYYLSERLEKKYSNLKGCHLNAWNKAKMAKKMKKLILNKKISILNNFDIRQHFLAIQEQSGIAVNKYHAAAQSEHNGDIFWAAAMAVYYSSKKYKVWFA